MAHTHCWVEYTLLYLNGSGHQPYETIAALGAHFEGGQYVHDGVYYGLLNGTDDQCHRAVRAMSAFGAREIEHDELIEIIYSTQPINTPVTASDMTTYYLGPVIIQEDGNIVRELSIVEWSAPTVPQHLHMDAPNITISTT